MKKFLFLLAIFTSLLFAKPIVTTTILPTKFLVEQIANDTVQINTMIAKGADPHTYEPKTKQMELVEKSDIYFSVGSEFDKLWVKKFEKLYPNLLIVNTDENIKKINYENDEYNEHEKDSHKEHSSHEHSGLDIHIWLDPILMKTQALNIKNALSNKYPNNSKLYESNYEKLIQKIDEVDNYAKTKLKNVKNKKFIVYHPSWGYFAKRYNLIQIPIEFEGKEPKPSDLAKLINEANKENIKVIFVAPQFSKKSAKIVSEQTKAKIIEIDHLSENWLDTMKKTVDVLNQNL